MPTTDMILTGLQSTATTYQLLGLLQHLLLVLVVIYAVKKPKHSGMAVVIHSGYTLMVVAFLAIVHAQNMFTGIVLGVLGLVLIASWKQEPYKLSRSMMDWIIGMLSIVVGYWYPHFADALAITTLRSAYGLLPCPTLMVILGLMCLNVQHRNQTVIWFTALVGLFYGIKGVMQLHVTVDIPLIVISVWMICRLLSIRWTQARGRHLAS